MGRIIEASAHITMGVGATAKATKVVTASVNMDVSPAITAAVMPKELEGLTIVLKGPNALEMMNKIAQAIQAINDPGIDPVERQTLIDAIKAYMKPKEELT